MILKEYPKEELPREKAILNGISSLSNVEILALLLRTGNKSESVIEVSLRVLNQIGGMSGLKDITYHQLISIKGIKKAKAVTLLGAIELAKRITKQTGTKVTLNDPKRIYQYMKSEVLFEKQEKVFLLCLNTRLEIMKYKLLFIGGVDSAFLAPNEVLKEALLCGSKRIVLVHNHPSGNPEPSIQDVDITTKIKSMAKNLEIEFVDHIIMGEDCFYSFTTKQIEYL